MSISPTYTHYNECKIEIAEDLENKFRLYCIGDIYRIDCTPAIKNSLRKLFNILCDTDPNSTNWDSAVFGGALIGGTYNTQTMAASGTISNINYDLNFNFNSIEKLLASLKYIHEVANITFSLEIEMFISSKLKNLKQEERNK